MENNLTDCFLSFICKGSNINIYIYTQTGGDGEQKKNYATNKQINPLFVNMCVEKQEVCVF